MPNQVRVGFGITGASKAESDLDRLKNKLTGIQKAGAGGVGKGIALGIGIGVVNQATMAVGQLGAAIGDAVQAAIADEESQNRLRASLKANIPAWDGNTDAIEKNIVAKQRLGFDDETLRDSLTVLAGATNDVAKAEKVQAIAMDLARFKGIDLRTASEALIKVEAGVFRSLKSLGIELRDGATQTEALAAVQKVAAGQAEAYAATTAGKLTASQIKFSEAMENLGSKALPLVATAADAAAVAVDGLALAFGSVDEETGKATPGILDYVPGIAQVKAISEDAAKAQEEMAGSVRGLAKDLTNKASPAIVNVAQDIEDRYIPKINKFASETKDTRDEVVDYFGDLTDAAIDSLEGMVEGFFDPIETRYDILEAHRDLEAARTGLRMAKTATAIHDATDEILENLGKQAEGLADLGKQGELTKADVLKFKKDTAAAYKALGKSVPAELQAIINKLDVIAGYGAGAVDINVRVRQGVQGHSAGRRASGGPVREGEAYMVGEEGPEMFVPDASGSIKPNDRMGGDTYNLTFTGAIGQDQNNIIAQVNRMRYYSRSKKAA